MDPNTGTSWENDDGTISIVKTEIEECDPDVQDIPENESNGDDSYYPSGQDANSFNETFMPKQEGNEPHVPKQEPNDFPENGMEMYPNYIQETSSSMGGAPNWPPLLQGFSMPEAEEHFMNQPGTSDINDFAFNKRESELYPCKYCDYVGTHQKLLNSHVNNRHIKAIVYHCPHCPYSSTIPRSAKEHIECKHNNESDEKLIIKRKCAFCDYSASSTTALKNHMNKHTKEKKHQCSFCEFNTLWEGYLKMHIRRKHSDQSAEVGSVKGYPCQYCDYKAATPSTLKLHTNKHTREQEHQCPYCPYKTVWTTYIKLHIQNKHFKAEKPPPSKEHPCSFCDYKAKNTTMLRQHMNKHTREKVHQCPHCPFNTLWVTYMKLHIKRKHTENNENEDAEKKVFQCQYCSYKAISLSHLKIHENKHTKAVEYKCEQCDFKTTWFGYLKFHIKRKHSTGVKDEDEKVKTSFPCNFCSYKAINLSTLKVHQNKHTRENIYNCPHCEFKTTWRAYIKSHIQRHNADNFKTRKQGDGSARSYPCQYCSYVATQLGSLKLHVNSKHTRENMHKCPECDYECAVYGNLRMHIRRKHGLKPDEKGLYHCTQCEFTSEDATVIKTHLNEKHELNIEVDDIKNGDEKVYSCQYCSYTTLYQQVMKKHINKHTRQNVIKCPHCPYSTVWNHYMKVHIKRHNEPKTLTGRQRSTKPNTDKSRLFPCQYCDHRSLSFSSLRDHINSVHTREVLHKCPYCEHKCTLKGNLKGHIRRKHPAEFIEQEKKYQCEHCDFKTSERRNLKIHLKKEHNIDDAKVKAENGEYKCQFCDYKARSFYTLKIHRHKHTKENAYRCPQCEFATKWPNYLRKHIKQHSIGKCRVACLYCEYKGCSTFRLRKHIESLHKAGDYYPCPKLNCLFKTIHYTSLRMHLKGSIHATGVPRSHMSVSRNFSYKYRPNEGRYFACDYCDYASKTQGNLDKHIENKHERKGMKCGLCSYRTPSKNYLARHYKLRHTGVKKDDLDAAEVEEETETVEKDAEKEEDEFKPEDVPENPEVTSFTENQNEVAPDVEEGVPAARSKRKRSYVPYYVEDSEEEENELICADFLEVELGTNDKPSDSEGSKEQAGDKMIEPKVEIIELEPTSIEPSSSVVDEVSISEVKIEPQEEVMAPIEIAPKKNLTQIVKRCQRNGVSIRKRILNPKTIRIAPKKIERRKNGARRVIIKRVTKQNAGSKIVDNKSNGNDQELEKSIPDSFINQDIKVEPEELDANIIKNESHTDAAKNEPVIVPKRTTRSSSRIEVIRKTENQVRTEKNNAAINKNVTENNKKENNISHEGNIDDKEQQKKVHSSDGTGVENNDIDIKEKSSSVSQILDEVQFNKENDELEKMNKEMDANIVLPDAKEENTDVVLQ